MSHRKPREARLLQGNPSRRPLPEPIVVGARQVAVPPAPERLDPATAVVWVELAGMLTDVGYLVTGDLIALERLAVLIRQVHRVEAELANAELTVEGTKAAAIVNPLYRLHRDLTAQIHRLCVEFGLTPAARAKLGVAVATGATLARKLRDSDVIVTAQGEYSRAELIEHNNRKDTLT